MTYRCSIKVQTRVHSYELWTAETIIQLPLSPHYDVVRQPRRLEMAYSYLEEPPIDQNRSILHTTNENSMSVVCEIEDEEKGE